MTESLTGVGLLGLLFGLLVVVLGVFFLLHPRQPYAQGLGLGGCLTGFMVLVIATVVIIGASGTLTDQRLAVNGASQVSPQLAGEVSVAQRLTNDESSRVLTLANAERQNKEGIASQLEAQGKNILAQAQATKTIVESKALDDDRQAKKFGYAGLAAADLLSNVGGIGGLFATGSCFVMLLVGLGFLGGVKMMLGRHD